MTAASDIVGIGMIGAGFIADYHLDGLKAAGGAAVRAIAGRGGASGARTAARHGIADVVDDWRRLLERRDIEALIVATPDETHCEIACAAAAAGKAVLLQKPMARSSQECRRIVDAFRASGTLLQVSFMHRYFEEVVQARALLAEGRTGKVLSARIRNATPGPDWGDWFFSRQKVGGGVVLQLGVHGIDLVRHVLGDIIRLCATTALRKTERRLADGRIVHPDNEDHALAAYTFAAGPVVSHEMCYSEVAGTDRFSLEIYCEQATLHLRGPRGALAVYAPQITGTKGWVMPPLPDAPFGARHHGGFLDMVRGKAPPDDTPLDGLATLLVAEAIYRSAASGSALAVPPPADALAGQVAS
ncbi:Gfo/Idh/MocA family oxidoreductase [Vineibacter terrae]|uniref:Gfo/Idh/MocA family protein n=1 Tax=Vineibacter terrae TaxID=2586908 RepID=UPI002E344E07|nr:Gfo/Idh/MocA family oxidoreductase [Vineibacter terrae]HEX2885199.1 Gfo/Idh/MocA family oxidoreductase [Vineibacter terrae]